jgi:hypothetical protein
MTVTSKYIVLKNSGKIVLDFDLKFEDLNLVNQNILFSGSSQIDGIKIQPGTLFDFSNSKASSDIIHLEAKLVNYIAHFSIDNSGVINLTKGIGAEIEGLSFVSANTASDTLIFADYTTNAKAIRDAFYTVTSSEIIYIDRSISEILLLSKIDNNGFLDIFAEDPNNVTWLKVNPIAEKTLVFIDGALTALALSEALASATAPILDTTQTSLNQVMKAFTVSHTDNTEVVNDTALIKAIAFDQSGENFTGFGQNVTLNVSGNSGVDKIYITAGSSVDATNLKGSKDEVYFTGTWDQYSKKIDTSGNITFSRILTIDEVSATESVLVSNGSVVATRDMLIFADGSLTTQDAFNALKVDLEVLSTNISVFDNSVTTPQLPPVLSSTLERIGDNTLDVRSDIVFQVDQAVKAIAGKNITLTDNTAVGYQGETNTNSFTISVTSPAVTIDNAKGVIIVDVDAIFDLDLSSSYTLSVDNGAFVSLDYDLAIADFTDITFNTITPTAGSDAVKALQTSQNNPKSVQMDVDSGELIESAQWVSIEDLGNGTVSGTVSSLSTDIAAGNVFQFDAATGNYVFVFSDQNAEGFSVTQGSGITAKTDFSVYLQNMGADDLIYIDDAYNNKVNIVGFDAFSHGNGASGSELYWGMLGSIGDPRLYVDLVDEIVSDDSQGVADSSLLAVNSSLGLTDDKSLITSDSAPMLVNFIQKITIFNSTNKTGKQDDTLTVIATLSESFTLTLNNGTPTVSLDFSGEIVTAKYVSNDPSTNTIIFTTTAPTGNTNQVTLSDVNLDGASLVGKDSDLILSEDLVGAKDTQFVLDNTAPTLNVTDFSLSENTLLVGALTSNENALITLGDADDSTLFSITDNVLSLKAPVDFESDETSLKINVSVIDIAGNASQSSVNVSITNINEAPVSNVIAQQSATFNQAFTLDVTSAFSDVDADDELSFSIVGDLPAGLSIANGVIKGAPTVFGDDYQITVRATDSAGLFVDSSFAIDITGAPVIRSELSNLGTKMLDVRTSIVLTIDQNVSAVEGKNIVFTDNTAVGYQGETQQNNFSIPVTSELVKIDNEKGIVIINIDSYFALDLASNYTLSIDDGAFLSSSTNLATGSVTDITFSTVTPTSDSVTLSQLGQGDNNAAQSYMMSVIDGSLIESAQWIDIEGLGSGTNAGTISNLAEDIDKGTVVKIDAGASNYVFVFSDQNSNGGSEITGSGIATHTDFAVFIDNFGSDDLIFVDDAFNDSSALNLLSYEFFASGSGADTKELFVGLSGVAGDPRLYVGLADDLDSTDEFGYADSTIQGVAETLGHDAPDEFIMTA